MTVKWKYRIVPIDLPAKHDDDGLAAAQRELDRLGTDGWEAVGFSPSHASSHGFSVETTRYLVLLKRAVK